MHVDTGQHRRPHVLDRRRVADPGGMVVDQVALELSDLLVAEHDFRELADPGVDAVHDLAGVDLLLEHAPTGADALDGGRGECHLLAAAGDADDILDREILAGDLEGHGELSGCWRPSGRGGAGLGMAAGILPGAGERGERRIRNGPGAGRAARPLKSNSTASKDGP